MICKFIHKNESYWDEWLYPLFVCSAEGSTGLHRIFFVWQKPQGVLDLIKETWEEGLSTIS